MRKLFFCGVTVLFLLSVSSFAGDQDFILHNETGLSIVELYVSPTEVESWEEDVLGRDVLSDGENCRIRFHEEEDICSWDILIVDEDGDKVTWTGLDLCSVSDVTLYWEDGRAWADVE